MEAVFPRLNFNLYVGFLPCNMTKVIIKLDMALAFTLNWIFMQQPGNFDLSTLAFLNYEYTHIVKALVGIFPNRMGLIFLEIYPWSISDSNIRIKSDLNNRVGEEYIIMSSKGLALHNFWGIKGVYLNKPPQKNNTTFRN